MFGAKVQLSVVTKGRDMKRETFLSALGSAAGGISVACIAALRHGAYAASTHSHDLNQFMALSAILTGYSDLNPDVGAIYLQNMRACSRSAAYDALVKQIGLTSNLPPKTLADLQKAGAFTNVTSLSLTTEILENWYSGKCLGANGATTVTWTQALAWKACSFTKPPSLCDTPGAWTRPPAT
jgi:hypothetical protein